MKKTALITGGARRVGKKIAVDLVKKGYRIAIQYNSSAREAEATKLELESNGAECRLFKCDFSADQGAETLIDEVYKQLGRLDVLINNASLFIRSSINKTTSERLQTLFKVNLFAPYILSRDFHRICKKGVIINLLDTKISKNDYHYSAYTLTKQALANLTFQSALEFAPEVRVNGICPGIVLPPDLENSQKLPDPARKIPLQKTGSCEDVTAAIDFLLINSYITGQIIYLDGGQHLTG